METLETPLDPPLDCGGHENTSIKKTALAEDAKMRQ